MSIIFTHLAETVHILQDVFYVVLMIRIVASFFPPRTAGLWDKATFISTQLTEPILAPIRRRVPLVGMLDLSPLIAFFLVDIASYLLVTLFLYLARF
ncbi:YggT family protein [Sulfobacillus thermosulfidooxidans]|uniref:YggT family protein n=1 Tax=Sulfobacillus thermosulfidooxidans TaxID=28034 RepID=UPI0006B438B0|nr:YggT family protein [Sulfobacillus thermosulfidooxidans]